MKIGCATFLRFTNSELSHPTFKHRLVVRGFCNLPFRGRSVPPAGRHSKTAGVNALHEDWLIGAAHCRPCAPNRLQSWAWFWSSPSPRWGEGAEPTSAPADEVRRVRVALRAPRRRTPHPPHGNSSTYAVPSAL